MHPKPKSTAESFVSDCAKIFAHGTWNDLAELAAARDQLAVSQSTQEKLKDFAHQKNLARLPLYHIPGAGNELQQKLHAAWREGPAHTSWQWALAWISSFKAPWHLQRNWTFATLADSDIEPALIFLLKLPIGWSQRGETDIYANYLKLVLTELADYVGGAPPARRHIIDDLLLKQLDISLALFGYGNLQPLTRIRAKLLQDILRRTHPDLPLELHAGTVSHAKRRLGIVIRYFKPFIDNWMLAGFFASMPRDRYEITLYSVQDIENRIDANNAENRTFQDHFKTLIDRYVSLDRKSLPETVNHIRGDEQDIIIFGNTMQLSTSKAHLLHAYRLAPQQIVTTITTSSTGFDSVDYYISATCTEPANGADHYREKLLLLPGFFYALAFDALPAQAAGLQMSDNHWLQTLDIPPQAPLFINGSGWPKLTPETIELWMEILKSAPEAHLVLYPNSPSWRGGWFAQSQKAFIDDCLQRFSIDPKRCHIVEPQSTDDILRLCERASLYLDAFPYSGNMALREPLLMVCPVLTRATAHQRGMQGAAVLRSLGLDDFVVDNDASYCEKALSLAKDDTHALRSRIRDAMRRAPFYDTASVSKAFAEILDRLSD